jgi:hypothetical protein
MSTKDVLLLFFEPKDVLFEIQSLSEVKEGACYMQNFLV